MADLKPATKTIDGITFTLLPVGAWESFGLFHSLVTILGSMSSVISDVLGKTTTKKAELLSIADKVDLAKLFDALPGFLERADPVEFRRLTEMMLGSCTFRAAPIRGKQQEDLNLIAMFDTAMQGKLFTVFKLVAWAIQVNFADFFSGAASALAARKAVALAAQKESESNSPPSEQTPPAAE